jgi:hypothetical protein
LREFPHLVEMHKKYGNDGLVAMSVSVDEADKEAKILEWLNKFQATFPNYRLDEPYDVWSTKWDVAAQPVVFVFDRLGRRAAKFSPDEKNFTYNEDVEPLVKKLLSAKP